MTKAIVKKAITILFIVCLACCAFFVYNSAGKDTVIAEATGETTTSGYTFVDNSADAQTGTGWRLTENGTLYVTQGTIDINWKKSMDSAIDTTLVKNFVITADSVSISYYYSIFSNLEGLYIDADYTSLNTAIFNGCTKLETIYIKHLDSLPNAADGSQGTFGRCSSLKTLTIDGLSDTFRFGTYSFNDSGSAETGFDLSIKGTDIEFGTYSFYSAGIKTLKVTAQRVTFDESAFWQSDIQSVELNSDYTSLSAQVFNSCASLETVYIKHLDVLSDAADGGKGTFSECRKLTSLTIDNFGTGSEATNCMDTEGNAFKFGTYSFYRAGYDGTGFDLNVNVDSLQFAQYSFYSAKVNSLTVTSKSVTFDEQSFYQSELKASTLKSIELNSDYTSLGTMSFSGCSSLESIYIKHLDVLEDSSSSSNGAFSECTKLTSLTIDELSSSFTFGTYAFYKAGYSGAGFDLNITGDVIVLSGGSFCSAKINTLKINASSIDMKSHSFETSLCKNYIFNVDSMTIYSEMYEDTFYRSVDGKVAYLKKDMTNYTAIKEKLMSKHEFTVNDYEDGFTENNAVYVWKGTNLYSALKDFNDKTITSFVISENCKEILAGAFDGLNSLTYNEYENGLYVGSSTNQYYALIKAKGDITLHEDLVVIADDAFKGLANIKVTIPENIHSVDVTKFSGATKAELVIPNTWTSLTANPNGNTVLKNIGSATNLIFDIKNLSNITSLSVEELDALRPNTNSSLAGTNVKIVNYAQKDTDKETVLHIGEMLEGVVDGYTGNLFYVWKIGSGLDYRIFTSSDTISQFGGTSFDSVQKYYKTNFIATNVYDNITTGTTVTLEVYDLQSTGLKFVGTAKSTLNTQSLTETIPDIKELTLLKGEYKTYDSILTDFAVLHAGKCAVISKLYIESGSDVVSLADRRINCDAKGRATIKYTITSAANCFCHGEIADSTKNKILYINVIEANDFDSLNVYINATLTPNSYVYDGTNKTPTLTVFDSYTNKTLTEGTDYELDSASVATAKDIDTYSIIVKGIGDYTGQRTLTWRITKNLNTAQVTIDDWTYGDTAKSPVITNNSTSNTPVYTYKLKSADDSTYTSTVPTNAGTYILKTVIAGDNDYEEFVSEVEFNIFPKAITVKIDNKSSVYGDAIAELTATCNGIVSGDNAADIYTLSTTATSTSNVGDYDINGTQKSTCTNYTVTFENGTYTITAKAITVKIDNKSSVYGDPIVELTATCNGIISGDNVAGIYTLSTDVTSTSKVGKYVITGTQQPTCANYTVTFINGTYEISNEDADADTVATINIIIKDGDTPVDNASVELIYLERIIQAGETDENGAIAFTNVLYGNYSIAVIYNSTKLTDAIDVFESSVDKTVVLPKAGFNTILKGDAATSSDNLSNAISTDDKNSASGTVTITMTANYTADQDIIDLITDFAKNEDSGITMVDFIDVGVDNNGNAIKTTYGYQNIVFEISNAIADAVKSYGTEKYDHLIVYREHDGVVNRLNKVTYADGMNAEYECFFIKCVNDHYYITIHVKNFSTYAFSVTTSTVPYYVDANSTPDPTPAKDGGFVNVLECFIHWITLLVTIIFVIFELFVLLYTARTSYDEEETKVLTGDDAKKALKNKDDDTKVVVKEENKKEQNSQEVLDKVESKEVTTKIKRHKPLWWINLAVIIVFAVLSVVLFMLGFCVICLILMIIDIILAILALILLFRNFIINHLKDTKNVTLSKFVKYLQKIDESVSLKDAINLVPILPVALFDEINKKTIADYVDTLENTTTNRKEDFVKGTKLYLADTHYITYKLDNGKSKKKCFIYVYQDLDNKKVFLLLKLTMKDLDKFVEDHPLCTTSRFPIGFEWTFVGIDETFKFSDVEDLIKLTIEVVSKDDSQKNKKVDKTSAEQNAYMSSVKDTEGNLLDQDDKKDN